MARRSAPRIPPETRFDQARFDVIDLAGQLIHEMDNPRFTVTDLHEAIEGLSRYHLMAAVWQLASEFDEKGATYDTVKLDLMAEQMSDVEL